MISETSVPRTPAEAVAAYDRSVETVGQHDIIVIQPDEYDTLVGLSDKEARELPEGLYVVGDTIRDRMEAMGVSYETLNRAVLSAVGGESLGQEENDVATLTRKSSAHVVFFGRVDLHSNTSGKTDGALVAVKPHRERGDLSAKPFREIGNLALLQDSGMEGVYKPIGVLNTGAVKFVLTEARPGVRTLDDHKWIGKRTRGIRGEKPNREEVVRLHDRDALLVRRSFELFGSLHGQGIFHGDAQMKNVGWSSLSVGESSQADKLTDADGVLSADMTIIDLENAKIFRPQNGDLPKAYYDQLIPLMAKDLRQFFGSVPRQARTPMKAMRKQGVTEDGFTEEQFIQPYVAAFVKQRAALLEQNTDDSLIEDITRTLKEVLGRF